MFNNIPKFNYKKFNNFSNYNENINVPNSLGKDWYKIIKSKNEIENKLKVRVDNLQKTDLSIDNNSSINNNQFSVERMVDLEDHTNKELNDTFIFENQLEKNIDIPNEKFSVSKMTKLFNNLDIGEISEENIVKLQIYENNKKVGKDYITNIKVDNILEYNNELINNYNKENYKKKMNNLIDNIHIQSDLNISDINIFNNNIGNIQENINNIQNNYNEKKMRLDEEFQQIGKNIEIKINKVDKKENKSNLLHVIDNDLKRELDNSNLKIKDIK